MKLFILSLLILAFARCTDYKTAEGDMLYNIVDDKGGGTIEEGDLAALTFSIRTEEGALLYNSNDEDGRLTLKFREKPHFRGDLFSALGLMGEGDSGIFKINIDSLVAKSGKPRPATAGKYLTYTLKVNKVIARGGSTDSLYNSRIEEFKASETEKARLNETSRFEHYLSAQSAKTVATPSGLYYMVTREGTGPRPGPGDSVELNYTVKFLSGKVIETSVADTAKKADIFTQLHTYGPVTFPVQAGNSLLAIQEALPLFPKGTKVTLIMPSRLAYGPDTYKNIQPYTPLLCELEIISIAHARHLKKP